MQNSSEIVTTNKPTPRFFYRPDALTRQKDGLHLFNINTIMVNVLYVIRGVYYGMVSQPHCNRMSVSRFKTLLKQHLLDCSREIN